MKPDFNDIKTTVALMTAVGYELQSLMEMHGLKLNLEVYKTRSDGAEVIQLMRIVSMREPLYRSPAGYVAFTPEGALYLDACDQFGLSQSWLYRTVKLNGCPLEIWGLAVERVSDSIACVVNASEDAIEKAFEDGAEVKIACRSQAGLMCALPIETIKALMGKEGVE